MGIDCDLQPQAEPSAAAAHTFTSTSEGGLGWPWRSELEYLPPPVVQPCESCLVPLVARGIARYGHRLCRPLRCLRGEAHGATRQTLLGSHLSVCIPAQGLLLGF